MQREQHGASLTPQHGMLHAQRAGAATTCTAPLGAARMSNVRIMSLATTCIIVILRTGQKSPACSDSPA
ncbi:MAG: hypothetical protein ACYCW6_20420, partial [Candidatus Xenobia bacterium]